MVWSMGSPLSWQRGICAPRAPVSDSGGLEYEAPEVLPWDMRSTYLHAFPAKTHSIPTGQRQKWVPQAGSLSTGILT